MSGQLILMSRGTETTVDPRINAMFGPLADREASWLEVFERQLLDARFWPCVILDAGLPEVEGAKPMVGIVVPPATLSVGDIECRLPDGVQYAEMKATEEHRLFVVRFDRMFSAEIGPEIGPRIAIRCSINKEGNKVWEMNAKIETRSAITGRQETQIHLRIQEMIGDRGHVSCNIAKVQDGETLILLDGSPNDPFPYPHARLYLARMHDELARLLSFRVS